MTAMNQGVLPVLTVTVAVAVSTILTATQSKQSVRWTPDGGDTIYSGQVRHLCRDDRGLFPHAGDDIRGLVLRITGDTGVEVFMPMADVIAHVVACSMVFEDRA